LVIGPSWRASFFEFSDYLLLQATKQATKGGSHLRFLTVGSFARGATRFSAPLDHGLIFPLSHPWRRPGIAGFSSPWKFPSLGFHLLDPPPASFR
jgi:hypothetical protein